MFFSETHSAVASCMVYCECYVGLLIVECKG